MRINPDNHRSGLCRWCVKPVTGTYVVSRTDKYQGVVSDYACDDCAFGWQQIADLDNHLVV